MHYESKYDGPIKSQKEHYCVIPAEAGIQEYQGPLDPGFRRGDGLEGFSLSHYLCQKIAFATKPSRFKLDHDTKTLSRSDLLLQFEVPLPDLVDRRIH